VKAAAQPVCEIDGVPCFAPELARTEEHFPAEAFARLVELEANNFWFRSRNRIISRIFARYLTQAGRPRVLEIGCGTGFVLSALHAQRRYELVGAEQHIAGLRLARQRLPDVQFVQLDARSLPYRSEFDAIGAFDVIEHIDEDEQVMASAHAALRPRGLFVVTVPQHAWLWSPTDDHAHHKRRYSRAELLAKMRRRGFAIRRCTSFVSVLLPLMWLSRIGKRKEGAGADHPAAAIDDELRLPRVADTIMDGAMRIDEALIRVGVSLPAGGSLLVVGEKVVQ
jgi:SAM-dependent methyltransferase